MPKSTNIINYSHLYFLFSFFFFLLSSPWGSDMRVVAPKRGGDASSVRLYTCHSTPASSIPGREATATRYTNIMFASLTFKNCYPPLTRFDFGGN